VPLAPDELDRLRVVLVSTRNPLNIGAAARAMSNFGFLRLRLVTPFDMSFREARSAVGATDLLRDAEVFPTVAEAIADCSLVVGTTAVGARQPEHPVYRLNEAAPKIHAHLGTSPAALLFGSEKRGLSNEDLSYCHWLTRIPTRNEHDSMNLGQAVAVCLYELIRSEVKQAPEGRPDVSAASGEELDRLTRTLLQALTASGYTKPNTEAATEEKARRLIRRMSLSSGDAETLTGMIAKIGKTRGRD
jgi:TrmH family RNA methyltransferase